MPAQVLTYAPTDVTIILAGYTLGGILSVELEWKSQPFTIRPGIRGIHTRTFSKDLRATIRLEVLQTSITNDVMSQILEQDRRNKSARLPITVKDTGGTTMYIADQAFIPRYPNTKLSRGFEVRVWEIEVLDFTDGTIGGNSHAAFDLFSSVEGALDYLSDAGSSVLDTIEENLPIF